MSNTRYNRLATIMTEHRITNPMLAKHLNLSTTTISKWRSNAVQPSLEWITEMAKFFKIQAKEFVANQTFEPGPSQAQIARIAEDERKRVEKLANGKSKSAAAKRKSSTTATAKKRG